MPPLKTSEEAGFQEYSPIALGPVDFVVNMRVDVSDLGTDQVDEDGVLIPGTPLRVDSAGDGMLTPVDGAGQTAKGLVLNPVKVADANDATTLGNADDIDVTLLVIGTVDLQLIEDNIGRDASANELEAIDNIPGIVYPE